MIRNLTGNAALKNGCKNVAEKEMQKYTPVQQAGEDSRLAAIFPCFMIRVNSPSTLKCVSQLNIARNAVF